MKALLSVYKYALASMIICLVSMPAHAQFVKGSNASTNIQADDLDYMGDVAILTGQVDLRQGDVRVLTDKMFIHFKGELAGGDFSKVIADGNFYYLTSEQEVRGSHGVYTKIDDTFVVTGDVILKQSDGNVVTGDKLYYNLGTRKARVVGTCKGRKCGAKGRVNILIKNSGDSGK